MFIKKLKKEIYLCINYRPFNIITKKKLLFNIINQKNYSQHRQL
jgi:hypothetical protein